MKTTFDVIITAAGESARFSDNLNKLFCTINGRTVVENSVLPFFAFPSLSKVFVATSKENFDRMNGIFAHYDNVRVILGGDTRTETVKRALEFVDSDLVLIHDGARPFLTDTVVQNVLDGLDFSDSVVPAIKIDDSIANVSESRYSPVSRDEYRRIQTPQGFKTEKLKKVYANLSGTFTDDASAYYSVFGNVAVVLGDIRNVKITNYSDLCVPQCRTGVGIDVHKLVENRKLVLGGVEIPYEKGLLGHSDADVLLHAITDALLTAVGERDIGIQFPDTDERYKDISSAILTSRVLSLVEKNGYFVKSVSATVACQRPKLNPYFNKIRTSLSSILNVSENDVSLAFTTSEGLGLVGAGDGISVVATAVVVAK